MKRAPGFKHSEATLLKMSRAQAGRIFSAEHRHKISLAMRGRPVSAETRRKMAVAKKLNPSRYAFNGETNPNWKGGATANQKLIRNSREYQTWRRHVFQRDDYTCQKCGERGGDLHADHELPIALFPSLTFEILNGRTLCAKCHRDTETFGSKLLKYEREFSVEIPH
jgi:hypothetical protein